MTGALSQYIASFEGVPFDWGAHDCLTFSNGAVAAVRGEGWCDDWLGSYSDPQTALVAYARHLRAEGKADFIDGVDSRLERVDTLWPRDGMVCAVPEDGVLRWSFGIVCGGLEWYMSEDGIVSREPDGAALYWRTE